MQKNVYKENLLKNQYTSDNEYGIPVIKKQYIDTSNLHLLGYNNTVFKENICYRICGVHFFLDDYKFDVVISNPPYQTEKLSQYAFVLTPDISLYAEMPEWVQISNVGLNRYIGAYWQSRGLTVIPTVSWSTAQSYKYCFCGIEKHSVVAVSTLGCKRNKLNFMRGYNKMLKIIEPDTIICYGRPFKEMTGNIITIKTTHLKQEVL